MCTRQSALEDAFHAESGEGARTTTLEMRAFVQRLDNLDFAAHRGKHAWRDFKGAAANRKPSVILRFAEFIEFGA